MSTITPGTPLYAFVDSFRKTLGTVLSQASPSPWKVTIGNEDVPPASGTTLCFGISLSGSLRGKAAFLIENGEALRLAQQLVPKSPDPAADPNAAGKQAIEQLLRKVSTLAAASLKEQFGEVGFELAGIEAPNWTGASVVLTASEASSGTISIGFRLDTELAGVLPAGASTDPLAAKAAASGDNNLDLLLGVELNLTLRFGQRTLTLREILELNSGSIIELDRQVQEPADLLLGEKLIARGEVVVVDGNYGVRIKEMCESPIVADKVGLSIARGESSKAAS
jgi:flagellar motor switch protein FliN